MPCIVATRPIAPTLLPLCPAYINAKPTMPFLSDRVLKATVGIWLRSTVPIVVNPVLSPHVVKELRAIVSTAIALPSSLYPPTSVVQATLFVAIPIQVALNTAIRICNVRRTIAIVVIAIVA
jgi:hypothetical protein